jgi:NAD(P)-dependent dehydrogenase (short-subunit alcohol dehydrogenase family)
VKAIATKSDVAKEDDVKATVDLAVKEFGRLDIMVRMSNLQVTTDLPTQVNHSFSSTMRVNI